METDSATHVSRGLQPPLEPLDAQREAPGSPRAVGAVAAVLERLAPLWARRRGLSVRWFDEWCATLDDALQALPEMATCPHELFRLLMLNPSPTRKRTALVTDREGPVAIIGLRRRGPYWQPVTHWTTPGDIAPCRAGLLIEALKAPGTPVRIPGWYGALPDSRLVRDVTSAPLYKIDCRADFREHWRGSGQRSFINMARRRTKRFAFAVDRDGAAEWIIRNWAEKWRDDPARQAVVASDLLLTAEYYQKRQQLHTFLLLDGGAPVAGSTCFVHGDELVACVFFRNSEYDRQGVGTRLMELRAEWAAAQGYAKLDLGAWESYKARWAPQDGIEWRFSICPLPVHLVERAVWKAEALSARTKGLIERLSRRRKRSPAGPAAGYPRAVGATGALLERLAPLWAKRRGLSVRWFDEWCAPLDEALEALPEMATCPHELFRLLMLNPSPTRKRACLVTDREGPIAIIGLRRRGRHWQPVTQWTTPGDIAPCRAGLLTEALEALGTPVRIPGWHGALPESRLVRDVTSAPVYKIDCRTDFQEHWRRSGQLRFIQKAQRRTQGFTFAVDRDGAAEWIIRNWAERWRDDPARQAVVAGDLLLAAEYYLQRGQLHTFQLLDDGAPVAGDLCFVRNDELMSSVIFRDREYDWHGAGTRLTELVTEWAAGRGYAKFDLGAWESYKARWAPQDGIEWRFSICPLPVHLVERAVWKAEALRARTKGLIERISRRRKRSPAGQGRSIEEEA